MSSIVKKIIPVIFLCLSYLFAYAQEVNKMTLPKVIAYALEHSPEIKIAHLNIEDAKQQITETKSTGLPQINAEVTYNHFFELPVSVLPSAFEEIIRIGNGGDLPPDFSNQIAFGLRNNFQAGINLRTMIFDGSFFTGLRAAELLRNLRQEELDAKQQLLESQVIEAYLPAIIIRENIKILDKNIKNVNKLLQETEALYKEGFVEQLDVDRLDLSLANLNTERESLENQYKQAINNLKMIIRYPVNQDLTLSDLEDWRTIIIPVTAEDLTGPVNYYQRKNYKAAETGIQLNDLNIEYTKKRYLPTINLNASYNQAYQGDRLFNDPNSFWAPTGIVGLSLNIPIIDGFGKQSKIERAQIASDIARVQQAQLTHLIDVEVANTRIQYKNATKRLESQEKNLALAERIFNTTQIKYREGVGSSLEIVQAEQSLFDTQRNYTQALFDVLTAKLDLYRALGK